MPCHAHRRGECAHSLCAQDDVPLDVKSRRLNEVIAAFRTGQAERNQAEIGSMHLV